MGKAAVAMHGAARRELGALDRELVIAPRGIPGPTDWDFLVVGDHPVVSQASLDAGAAALDFAAQARREGAAVWGLISGGSSALCESPGQGVTPEEVLKWSRTGLAAGLSIEVLNARRSQLSAVKAGRLGAAFGDSLAGVSVLVDIPSGRPEVVGSGPLAVPGLSLEVLATPRTLAARFAEGVANEGLCPETFAEGVDRSVASWMDHVSLSGWPERRLAMSWWGAAR